MENVLDTEFEWIGEIPSTWHTVRLKSLFDFGKGLPITKDDLLEQGVPVISYGQIHAKFNSGVGIDDRLLRYVSDSYIETNSSSLVSIGDILVADTSEDIEGCGNAVLIDKRMMLFAGYHTIILKSKELRDNRFLAYMMLTDSWRSQLRGKASGVKVFSISKKMLSECYFVIPSCSEQNRITEFLDEKCICITDIIDKTRTSIEEYKKLKHAIIAQAVTKGVRGERKIKDSGIEWIGEIAEGFEVKKLKYLCYILDQFRSPITADQRNQNAENLYDYYGASGAIDKIDGYTIDDHVMLIGEDGANLRMRNLPLMYEVKGKAWINNHAHILKPKEDVDFYYLFYALEALDINTYITGSAQPKLSQENLRRIWVPIPSLSEQKEIAAYLHVKLSEIDNLIDLKHKILQELETYKKSVIYEYVTGKKEICS